MAPRTTICATVGPACETPEALASLIRAGASVLRINGALARDPEVLRAWVARIREASDAAGAMVGILLDLPGTGLRVGDVGGEGRFAIRVGDELDMDDGEGGAGRIPLRSLHLLGELRSGHEVVLGDGGERLEVIEARPGGFRLRVREGGEVRSGMGIHFPGVDLPTAVPTKDDRLILEAGIEAGIDMVAQSFVRSGEDMARLKEATQELGAKHVLALAKIERVAAIEALDRIVERADALLVARGDLGIDAGVERVPSLQKRVFETCRRAARPVIVATEMLESMTTRTRPTRAEASDVAGAVFDGADGVMLTGETAKGRHPTRVVETMARILEAAEADPHAPYAGQEVLAPPLRREGRPDQHVVRAAVELAGDVGAKAIVVFTRRGTSAFRLSKERPRAAIHAFTPSAGAARRLTLAWGVDTYELSGRGGIEEILIRVTETLRGAGGLESGDLAVAVMGSPKDPAGATTLIKLLHV